MTPARIRRRRSKGWRLPAGAINVSRPSRWGNPYKLGARKYLLNEAVARQAVVDAFRTSLEGGLLRFTVADVRRELRGRVLCCWCPLPAPGEPDRCHAQILIEIANANPEREPPWTTTTP
jgi:Domain of unknown function (DUF4326)